MTAKYTIIIVGTWEQIKKRIKRRRESGAQLFSWADGRGEKKKRKKINTSKPNTDERKKKERYRSG